MTPQSAHALAAEVLLAFWAEAGVDACLEAEPVDKLARRPPPAGPEPRPKPPAPAARTAPPVLTPDLADAVARAQALAAEAADLPALERALAAYDGAFRPAGGRSPIFLRGAVGADVVVLGGPPGEDEEATGAAFAGAAGRLLDRMLAAAGLGERALALHVVPWRPPGDRPPLVEEAAVARPFVARAVELARPAALLLVGEAAVQLTTLRKEGVLKLRNEALSLPLAPDVPAFVTFGPAFLLRTPNAKAKAWADLLSLAARVATLRPAP